MPQVDLETLVCGGGSGDRKIACETQINGDPLPETSDLPENPPDYPAESFYLSKEDELDWFDRNVFYERKESTKGNSNSNSNSNPNLNLSSNSTSQRFSLNLKSKASIIGLPKIQKSCFVDCKLRRNCKPANARFFPKRSQSSGKSAVLLTEPSSPKVSCIGRVRSKKERSRRLKARRRPKETLNTSRPDKTGFWSSFKAVLRFGRGKNKALVIKEKSLESPSRKSVTAENRKTKIQSREPVSEPPGLGGLNRFASGRRSDSWGGGEVELEVAEFDSSDRGKSIWRRRAVGQLNEVDCGRDWQSAGPASV